MAKFLIATMSIPGHVAPTAPVARALVERGNEVVWYSSAFFQAKIEATGARFMPVKSTLDYGDSEYNKYFPERAKLQGFNQIKFDFKHVFIDAIEGYLKDIREILGEFKADVLLADPAVAAAKILGDEGVLPWAILNITVLGTPSRDVAPFGLGMLPDATPFGRFRNRFLYWMATNIFFRDVQKYYDDLANAHQWPHFIFRPNESPFLYLQPSLPSFEYPRSDLPSQLHFIGPLLPDAPKSFTPPAWWDEMKKSARPVVVVTQGTIATDAEQLIVPTLQALAGENVFMIGTTGGKSAAELGVPIPANAHVEPFIPFTELLPYVNVMITNGGYGGVTMALANGVPVICGGTTEDKPEVGNRITYSGIGINLKTATPTPEQIKTAVHSVMSDASYRRKAQQLKAEAKHFDAPAMAADLLETLARTKKPVYAPLSTEVRTEASLRG